MSNEAVLKQQLTEALARIAELEPLVYQNTVTSVPNRRALERRLEIIRGYEYPGTFQAMYFDFDRFKSVNDDHSHSVADNCLREVSDAVQGLLRNDAELFHMNGDEFIVIIHIRREALSEQLKVAHSIAERILNTIRDGVWTESKIKLTSSIGLTTGAFRDDHDAMLNRAEMLMRESKKCGRDQISVCNQFVQHKCV